MCLVRVMKMNQLVFGESNEDEPAPYRARHEIDEESHVRFTHVCCPFYLPILGKK